MIRNDLQSRTIDALRMVLIVCVVLVHAYTATRADIDTAHYPIYRFVSFFISLNIAQIAIPGFFFISGYLYFHTQRTYTQRLRREWHGLIIPYLFWNTLILGLYWCVECIPGFGGLFSGDNLPVHDYSFMNFLRAFWDCGYWDNGNGTPILHQFWYIRNLLILGIISPLLRRYIHWTGIAGIAVLLAWWIFTPGQGMVAKSFAFFALGGWYSIRGVDFLPQFNRRFPLIAAGFWITVVIVMCFWEQPWSVWLNRANDILGLMFFICVTAWALSRRIHIHSLAQLQGLSFFIYATHDPLIILVKRLMFRMTGTPTDTSLTVIYFLSTLLVLTLCVMGYYLIQRLCPQLMSVMVGTRSPHKPLAR